MMARAAVPALLLLNFDKKHPLTQDGRAPGAIVLGVDKLEKLRNAIGPSRVFLQVEDDGPGVPQAERGRVMQRFYRVPGTVGEGTGLGLAIAGEIARVHHASLTLGQAGKGAGWW
jgi:signal transduction histidine kinase